MATEIRVGYPPDSEELQVNLSDACAVVGEVVGRAATLINTGGNCGALQVTLEGGTELLVTDGDVFFADGGSWQPFYNCWTVGLYRVADENCGEPLAQTFGPMDDYSAEALSDTIRRCLQPA